MKINNLLISALFSAVLFGCGGSSQNLDTSTAPPVVQRMLAGGAPHAVQADAVAATAVNIAGYRDNYMIAKNQTTSVVTVTNKIDNSVTAYKNPSLIKFFDKWTSFDIDGSAGQVYRLYQAAFNRKPDLPGLGFWIKANESGRAAIEIASDFVVSTEFKTLYGDNPTHMKLINAFYNNVLHRDGEKAGIDWWAGQMENGAPTNGVLYGFSDSAENKNNLAADMQNGFDYEPYQPGGPIIPKRYSYANAKGLNFASQKIPSFPGTDAYGEGATGGVAFGDFMQTGQLSLVVFTNRWSHDINQVNPVGAIHFYQYVNGEPVDVTSKLLRDTTGCVSPRRLIVADFNNDGKPDVFAACHGAEFGDYFSWPGEQPRLLLSQPDGTYKNLAAPLNCYCHAATAGDIDGNGTIDILVSDMNASRDGHASLKALINDGAGNFTVQSAEQVEFINRDANYFMGDKPYYNAFLTLELIDFDGDGKLDLFLGSGENTQATMILKGTGDGKFMTIAKQFPKTDIEQQIIDVIYVNHILYELVEQPNRGGTPAYIIRKYSADMGSFAVLADQLIQLGATDNPLFLMPYDSLLVPYNLLYSRAAVVQ